MSNQLTRAYMEFSSKLKRKIAEIQSPQSDLSVVLSITANINGAEQAKVFLFLASHYEYWETDKIYENLANQAYKHNYDGEWSTVQAMLELEEQTPEAIALYYIEKFGPHAFYGNFLPKAGRYWKLIKHKDLTKPDTRKVKKTNRKRGYDDKGSLRLPHEQHGEKPVGPEKIDRRRDITHPLLEEHFLDPEEGAGHHIPERSEIYYAFT